MSFELRLMCFMYKNKTILLGKLQEIYIRPKLMFNLDEVVSSWNLIDQRTYHIGIYGPSHMNWKSLCCLYISPCGFCPPYIKHTSKR